MYFVRWFVFPGWVHIDIKGDGFMITHTCHCVLVEIRDEFEVSTRSSIFPESNRVGSLTMFVNPNSPIISMSLLCLAAVCELVEHIYCPSLYLEG